MYKYFLVLNINFKRFLFKDALLRPLEIVVILGEHIKMYMYFDFRFMLMEMYTCSEAFNA